MLHKIKKLIRPLVPDRIVAWLRRRRVSQHRRINYDVFCGDRRQARAWRILTPDTYRVRLSLPEGEPTSGVTVLADGGPVPDDLRMAALQALADPSLGAAIVGEAEIQKRRVGVEPEVGPRLVAIRDGVLEEIGGAPTGESPLVVLHSLLRQTGHRIGLIPIPRAGAPTARLDRITRPTVIILAVVPMHDVGGGARSTQIALELLRQGYHVVLAYHWEAQESVDLGLRFVHPELEQYHTWSFDLGSVLDRAATPGLVIVEAPVPHLVDLAAGAKERGWEVVYDIIDDWSDPALGGLFYKPEYEDRLVRMADRVVGSAPDLVERARRLGREAELVPNAVNAGLFGADLPPRPDDFPDAALVIGYHGSLYGDWLDWDSMRRVAETFPEAVLVVIGDDKVSRPEMPANVVFLGLKPQTDLPAYVQRFDVGLLPFKVNDTTHAVSPLKVFEYLASGVPVAAPPLRALDGLSGVETDTDLVAAVKRALEGPRPDRAEALRAHSWEQRVGRLTRREAPGDGSPAKILTRPGVHWPEPERIVD
ncbi:MAG: glycosyltransferase [Actinomycetes bacterium]|jgi:glycosyltransferase involved in cell wall biosynthesis